MRRTSILALLLAAALLPSAAAGQSADDVFSLLDDSISECLDDGRLDEARRLLGQAKSTDGLKQNRYYYVMLYHEGSLCRNEGDFDSFKQNRLSLLAMLPIEPWPELSISVPMDLGVAYRREGQNDSALHFYDQALQAAVAEGDVEWQAAISLNVGILHHNLNRLDEAEHYLDRSVELERQVDDPYTLLCALQTDGAVKVMLKKPSQAEPLLREAYALAQEAESADWQLRCLTTMLPMFDLLQQPDSSAYYPHVGTQLLPQLPPQSITAVGYLTARANHYCLNKQWAEAAADFEILMQQPTAAMRTATVFEHIAQCYSHLGRWPEAYAYMDSARIQADSMASVRLTAQMADFNVKYRTMEKDLEINRLQTQRLWLAVVAIALLLVVAVAWLVYRQRRQRREAQMRISTLEDERRRIASELHDGLCNDLLALEMQLVGEASKLCSSAVGEASKLCSPAVDEIFGHLTQRLQQLRQQARTLSHQLMPPEFTHFDLRQLLQLYADALNRNGTISTTLTVCDTEPLSPQTSQELYRIVQEHTSNIVKGGTATAIDICIEQRAAASPGKSGAYRLTISDDGTPLGGNDSQGLGRRTLRDRITAIGGHCSTSHDDDGHNVFVLDFST